MSFIWSLKGAAARTGCGERSRAAGRGRAWLSLRLSARGLRLAASGSSACTAAGEHAARSANLCGGWFRQKRASPRNTLVVPCPLGTTRTRASPGRMGQRMGVSQAGFCVQVVHSLAL